MKKFILGILFAAALSSQALAKEAPEKMLQAFPASIGTFEALQVEVYDEPGMGASLGYNDMSGIALTLYLYDLGIEDIKDGIASEVIKTAKGQMMEEIYETSKMGIYTNVKVASEEGIVFELDKGSKLDVLFVALSYDLPLEGQLLPMLSEAYVTGLKGQICKIRVSWPKDIEAGQRKEVIKSILSLLAA